MYYNQVHEIDAWRLHTTCCMFLHDSCSSPTFISRCAAALWWRLRKQLRGPKRSYKSHAHKCRCNDVIEAKSERFWPRSVRVRAAGARTCVCERKRERERGTLSRRRELLRLSEEAAAMEAEWNWVKSLRGVVTWRLTAEYPENIIGGCVVSLSKPPDYGL